jgi:hypothetical protein
VPVPLVWRAARRDPALRTLRVDAKSFSFICPAYSPQQLLHIRVLIGMFLPDQNRDSPRRCARRPTHGTTVRMLLGDPDSEQVGQRSGEEHIGDAGAGKIRNGLVTAGSWPVSGGPTCGGYMPRRVTTRSTVRPKRCSSTCTSMASGAHAVVVPMRKLSADVLLRHLGRELQEGMGLCPPAWHISTA